MYKEAHHNFKHMTRIHELGFQRLPIAVDDIRRSMADLSISALPDFSFSSTAKTSIGGSIPSFSARYQRFIRGMPMQG